MGYPFPEIWKPKKIKKKKKKGEPKHKVVSG